ncbi:MAG: hypothetical protein ACLGG0_04305 [Bacteriovoracia bacterium]
MLFRYSLLLILAMACGEKSTRVKYGLMTKAALISEKGEPQSVEKPTSTAEVLVYADNQKYQVSKDVVIAGLRDPSVEERSLLYWRHQFKDCSTTFKEMKKPDNHLHASKELSCAKLGLSVVYDPNIDQVTRVVEHAEE